MRGVVRCTAPIAEITTGACLGAPTSKSDDRKLAALVKKNAAKAAMAKKKRDF